MRSSICLASSIALAVVLQGSAAHAQDATTTPQTTQTTTQTTQTTTQAPAQPAAPGAQTPVAATPTAPAAGTAAASPVSQAQIDHWESGDPVPAGYHVGSKTRVGMIIGGAVITGITWGITALGAAAFSAADKTTDNFNVALGGKARPTDVTPLYIPVAGPFIQVATTGGGVVGKVFLLLDGAIQAGGAAMIIYGIVSPREFLVRDAKKTTKPTWTVAPGVGPGQQGLSVVGTF